ncbi:NERD domain-containing protein [Thermaerobacillus caldiproteolyticus]|uniref:NERD domain-containing protein n=1 Tax=Thermaerobacillus caldiproteolyticus TaxID=247480 RepID=UPI0018F1BA19|nr:NERD domain-containing protein [Anoxybacillus caldiproteolyticus]
MGQLIKLQDYISRYETDVYRYASEFIRLKKKHWKNVKEAWERGEVNHYTPSLPDSTWDWIEEKPSFFERMKNWFQRRSPEEKEESIEKEQDQEEELFLSFTTEPRTLDELKILFLEKVFQLQMKWASSTLKHESIVDKKFYYEEPLQYFLQRFPDTYLCLYKPVFLVKNAPVEGEIILLSPTMTWCMTFAEGEKDNIIIGSPERFWTEVTNRGEKRMLNPLMGLQRMEKIVRSIYEQHQIELPIKKVILNRYGYIDYRYAPSDVQLIDKRHYEQWFSSLRNLTAPLKHVQLKAASYLLRHCYSHYYERVEWHEEEEKV